MTSSLNTPTDSISSDEKIGRHLSVDLSDSVSMANARTRLEMALSEPAPILFSLLEFLGREESSIWVGSILTEYLKNAKAPGGMTTAQAESIAREASSHPEPLARQLIGLTILAFRLTKRGVLTGSGDRITPSSSIQELLGATDEAHFCSHDLLDVACFLPMDWCELYVRAARVLRGDPPEPADFESDSEGEQADRGASIRSAHVGGHRLLEPLGRGSFGAVYRAVHPELKRQVALKILRPEAFSKQSEARFLQEARILSSLSHPGIAVLYSAGFDQFLGIRLPYLAMELVQGLTLKQFVQEHNVTERAKVRLIIQACDALHHAHQNDVVHRDLHPGNLMVRKDGTLKVLDFGAALTHTEGESSTRSGTILGALAYISPEQARSSRYGVDARSDVFGLGAILFELLSGEPPHDLNDLTIKEAIVHVTDHTPRRLKVVCPEANRDLDAVCVRALAVAPSDRYSSALEFADDLRRFECGLTVRARPPSFLYALRKLTQRHRREVAILCLVLVLLSALGLSATLGWRKAHIEATDTAKAQAETNEMVVSVLELAEFQADKMDQTWDADGFYRTWSSRLNSMRIDDLSTKAIFLELIGRHEIQTGDYQRSYELREEVLAIRRELLSEAIESGSDQDAPTQELARALVRLGDSKWTQILRANEIESGNADVETKIDMVKSLFLTALDLNLDLAEKSPSPSHLDDLTWSYIRLYDFEVILKRYSEGEPYMRMAQIWSKKLIDLDPARAHSQFARSHIDTRLFRESKRAKDIKGTIFHSEQALAHAGLAYHGDPGRVPFLRNYQECLSNILIAASLENEGVGHPKWATNLLGEEGPVLRSLTMAHHLGGDPKAWQHASKFQISAAETAGQSGLHNVSGYFYCEAARSLREAQSLESASLRWFDELLVARMFKNAAAEFMLCNHPALSNALIRGSNASLSSVRSSDIPPELLALAEKLLFSLPPADPCSLRSEIKLLRANMTATAASFDESVFAPIMEFTSRLCPN